jgi:hypothetical protein
MSFSLTSLPKLLFILSPAMDPLNALSTATAARKIPPLKEAPPAKVMSCALVALTDLEKDLYAAKEVTRGAGAPLAKIASQPANSPGQPAMVCGQSTPHDEGRSPPVSQGSPLYPRSWNAPGLCSFPSSNDREGASIGHAYTSHYGDPHSKEGDRPVSTHGPFKQQR